jgi:hypothetical protein
MPTVKEDLERLEATLKKELFEESSSISTEDSENNSYQISVYISNMMPQRLIKYKKELDLAIKAWLATVTYADGNWLHTEYDMKGIPCEILV